MDVHALIAGRVRDDFGSPIAEARVMVVSAPGATPDIAALTDHSGYFSVPAHTPGEYILDVVADRYEHRRIHVTIADDVKAREIIDVELRPAP